MKAEKGDLIRVTGTCDGTVNIGDIVEVEDEFATDFGVFVKGGGYVRHTNYVVHRKAGEEDERFIGDQDAVNPSHYKQGRVEVIDIIEDAVQGADPFEAVCQANIIKYSLRYRHKNGTTDLRKAVWYTEKLIAYLDAKATQTTE